MALVNAQTGVKAYRFRIPLKQRIGLKGRTYEEREGVLLEREGQWSEASPLPGFSHETIDEVVDALRGKNTPPPALEFALSALDTSFSAPLETPINSLLLGNRDEVLAQANACHDDNPQAVKMKVGQRSTAEDAEIVRQVCECLPEAVSVRLDANQTWEFEAAVDFARRTSDLKLEYIEEPLREPERLEELCNQTAIKYALDETLAREQSLDKWPSATALICKPTLLGGRAAVERLAATGKPIVFSAAFESGIGIARVAQLAREFSPATPAGLDTLAWLSADLLCQPPIKHQGILSFPSAPIVDSAALEEFATEIYI